MKLRLTGSFDGEYKRIIKGNTRLEKRVVKQLGIIQKNINHPSLRLHKLQSSNYWSVSIDESIRILFIIEDEYITVYHIGKHEDVY